MSASSTGSRAEGAPVRRLDKQTVAFLKWSAEQKGLDPKNPRGYHIDHLTPLRFLDPLDLGMLAFANSPANVRWLSAWENMRRGASLPTKKELASHLAHVRAWKKTL